jgi:hypothetical protein
MILMFPVERKGGESGSLAWIDRGDVRAVRLTSVNAVRLTAMVASCMSLRAYANRVLTGKEVTTILTSWPHLRYPRGHALGRRVKVCEGCRGQVLEDSRAGAWGLAGMPVAEHEPELEKECYNERSKKRQTVV